VTFELTEGGHVMANDIGAAVQASKISTAQAATLAAQSDDDFVDIVEVESICGLSRSTIYRKLADPEDDFPRPVSLSLRRSHPRGTQGLAGTTNGRPRWRERNGGGVIDGRPRNGEACHR
jgi:predicted DNA-binding transcriptional regulator AlpA